MACVELRRAAGVDCAAGVDWREMVSFVYRVALDRCALGVSDLYIVALDSCIVVSGLDIRES